MKLEEATLRWKHCGYMNMPRLMAITTYNDIVNTRSLHGDCSRTHVICCGEDSRGKPCYEFSEDVTANVAISADGTWQHRGYSELNGAATIIGIGNVNFLDFEVLSKLCKVCETWEPLKVTASFDEFMKTSHCPVNHPGSAGSMEAAGVLQRFQRSTTDRKLRYTMYIGDGATKAYSDVVEADPYPEFPVKEGECNGHIQKRVGTHLRNLIKNTGLLTDDKPLGERSFKDINKLHTYFGVAIRQTPTI